MNVVPKLVELFKSPELGEFRQDHLLRALSHLMESVPKEVLLAELPSVCRICNWVAVVSISILVFEGSAIAAEVPEQQRGCSEVVHTQCHSLSHLWRTTFSRGTCPWPGATPSHAGSWPYVHGIYMQLASYPNLPHSNIMHAIISKLSQKARRSGQFCNVMMMSSGHGLANSLNHNRVLAKPRPGDIVITSQNRPHCPAFWNHFEHV